MEHISHKLDGDEFITMKQAMEELGINPEDHPQLEQKLRDKLQGREAAPLDDLDNEAYHHHKLLAERLGKQLWRAMRAYHVALAAGEHPEVVLDWHGIEGGETGWMKIRCVSHDDPAREMPAPEDMPCTPDVCDAAERRDPFII